MKAVETLSVAEMCDEIRDAEVGITHEQLVNAYERLRLVAQELVEWIEGTDGDRYEITPAGEAELKAAREQALLYLTSWIARRDLIESLMLASGMKDVETLSVDDLCAEIREAPFYDDHADITPQQLRSAYERLHTVSRELVEWLDGSGDARDALERVERVGKGVES